MMEGEEKEITAQLSDSMSEWSLVNSQGELMQGDPDSDSSESSIEVVQVEGNETVSFRHGKSSKPMDINAEETMDRSGEKISEVNEPSEPSTEPSDGPDDNAANSQVEPCSISDSAVETSVSNEIYSASERTETDDNSGVPSPELAAAPGKSGISEERDNRFNENQEDKVRPYGPCLETAERVVLAEFGRETLTDHDICEALPQQNENDCLEKELAEIDGACCEELLIDEKRVQVGPNADEETKQLEGEELAGADGEALAQSEMSSLAPSDAGSLDSDFVQLDPENIGDLEAEMAAEAGLMESRAHLQPFSVDDNFRFLRGQVIHGDEPRLAPAVPAVPYVNNADESMDTDEDRDRDDETESFTEEGVDDRIESEQSDAGSSLNDVGDLSAFADIGDIPLVAGDVPRNYIHRPNNHLSTVLNVTLVLAAILTMGISLGIIMATDLEIEEWQNAYELQTIRVKQLESQLREKKGSLREQEAKVLYLEKSAKQLRASLAETRLENLRLKRFESGLTWMETLGKQEGGFISEMTYAVSGIFGVLEQCGTDDGDFTSMISLRRNESFALCRDLLMTYMSKDRFSFFGGKRSDLKDFTLVWDEGSAAEDVSSEKLQNDGEGLYGTDSEKKAEHASFDNTAASMSPGHKSPLAGIEKQAYSSQGHSRVELDVRQLQQSLSREQERALHWQSLYLMERRQRERERESEEWEDERDREQWERELEQEREEIKRAKSAHSSPDELECLKKILSANFTSLSQHVALWNVSMIADFANLSVLMSTVQDLKQTVMDSVQNVWKDAEQILEKMHAPKSDSSSQRDTNTKEHSIVNAGKIALYLEQMQQAIQNNSKHQAEALVVAVQDKLFWLKQGLNDLGQREEVVSMVDWLKNVTEVTSDVLDGIQRDASRIIRDRGVVLDKIKGLLKNFDISIGDEEVSESAAQEDLGHVMDEVAEESSTDVYDQDEHNNYHLEYTGDWSNTHEFGENGRDNDDHDDEDDDDEDDDVGDIERLQPGSSKEHGKEGQGSWTGGISNILTRTRKSLQHLGKKVSQTLGEIRNIWHKKDQPLIRIAKHLTSKFVHASVKLTKKMYTKIPSILFKGSSGSMEECQMLAHSKCIKKLRKQWQKQLLKDPCKVAGKGSYECHSKKKGLKRDVKEVSQLFYQLLKIKTFQPEDALKLSQEDVALHFELFRSFHERWGGYRFLLKEDMEWAVCQRDWWFQVLEALAAPAYQNSLDVNNCDVLSPASSVFLGGDIKELAKSKFEMKDYDNDEEEEDRKEAKDKHSEQPIQGNLLLTKFTETAEEERNSTDLPKVSRSEDDFDWYSKRARYRLQSRREKEKRQNANKSHSRWYKDAKDRKVRFDDKDRSDWYLVQARNRKQQRDEHHKSDWVFERAKHRRENAGYWGEGKSRKWVSEDIEDESWLLKHGHHREKKREDEHRADWYFDRAADRKDHHCYDFQECH